MSDASWQREAEQACEQWLDADSLPSVDAAAAAAGADERARRHMADQQFVDALLYSLSGRDLNENTGRVRRVMEAIEVERPAPAFTRRMAGVMSFAGLAAGLLIACTLLLIKTANKSRANEALAAIRQATLVDTDRIYRVLHTNPERGRPMDLLGRLYLRGTTGFVLQAGDTAFGRYGAEYWMVPQDGPVIVADDFNWLEAASSGDAIEVGLLKDLSVASGRAPLMQLSAIVELVQGEYDVAVQRGPKEPLPGLDVLTASRRSTDEALPATIQLTFDRETKVVHRVELAWRAANQDAPRHDVHFVLAPSEPVREDWYQHAAHHAAGRPVRRIVARPAENPSPAKAASTDS